MRKLTLMEKYKIVIYIIKTLRKFDLRPRYTYTCIHFIGDSVRKVRPRDGKTVESLTLYYLKKCFNPKNLGLRIIQTEKDTVRAYLRLKALFKFITFYIWKY